MAYICWILFATMRFSSRDSDSPAPKIILQQLKWLNNINEPAQLTAKLLEVGVLTIEKLRGVSGCE